MFLNDNAGNRLLLTNLRGVKVEVPGWLSQLSNLALDFSSGHDLTVHGIEPHTAVSTETAWNSLSLCLSLSPTAPILLMSSLSLS